MAVATAGVEVSTVIVGVFALNGVVVIFTCFVVPASTVTSVSDTAVIPGYAQGTDEVIALFHTCYGRPISMIYIDYGN